MRAIGLAVSISLLAFAGACRELPPPPADLTFDGLPVAGSLAFARTTGFERCLELNNNLRCRREGLRLMGQGPYLGAVDSLGTDGRGGFHQLTLWHDSDQTAVMAVGETLLARGWTLCRTGQADRGDQFIYRRNGARVRVSIDASYWGKRRVRVMPEAGQPTGRCW